MKQSTALKILLEGRNAFLTGSAGSGKTYTLNKFISEAQKANKRVGITASTGIAATHIEGQTIHAFSGLGILNELPEGFFEKWAFKKFKAPQIRSIDILVLDEISMLQCHQFELVDQIFRKVRRKNLPFGGVQVVLCGDFFQLPPISSSPNQRAQFVSTSRSWDDLDLAICYLTEQHRQADDNYVQILENLRSGTLTKLHKSLLDSRIQQVTIDDDITHLYTRNLNVSGHNRMKLGKLEASKFTYVMKSSGDKWIVESLKRNCLASERLELKKGALVIALKNDPEGDYVNGSRGIVTGFEKSKDSEVALARVELLDGTEHVFTPSSWNITDQERIVASITQVPLQLAWAITIHKSQGMTLDSAYIDLSNAFEMGMGYVALSRLRSLDGLFLRGYNSIALQVSPDAMELDIYLRERSVLLEKLYA
ncbi:MAG: AAA family ATPase [Candidatus Ancillula sp.]|jgi:ATP-dependent exoDNAse (exonuclease V) alpha subunit|nr:AAA family ATPase [Candidatus Ancillula sp.]